MSIIKRFWWIAVLIIVAIALIIGFVLTFSKKQEKPSDNNDNEGENDEGAYTWATKLSGTELEAAHSALSQGIKIDDPENDFYQFPVGSVQGDGRPDNPDPYPIPFTDLKSLALGADEQNLYVKFEYWGEFPLEAYSYEGEMIHGVGAQIEGFTFTNKFGVEDVANLAVSLIYVDKKEGQRPEEYETLPTGRLLTSYYMTPQGVDETLETIYETSGNTGSVFGGPGYDYIIAAYPLNLLSIEYGDEVTFGCTVETGSSTFHHEAADFILDVPENAKSGATIKYVLGSNTYENLGVEENMKTNN